MLSVQQIEKSYPLADGGLLTVLNQFNFEVKRGEVVAVVGESGAGKSTLLHILGTLDRPDSGKVFFDDLDVFAQSDEELAKFRNRRIGFVFQFHHLLPEFTAIENVQMPAMIARQNMSHAKTRAAFLLKQLGLGERMHHRPNQLSGGEQQRVAVARALMNEPDLILADEPTGNLDESTAEKLHQEIIRLSRTFNQSFIIVTHNPTLAQLADRVLRMEKGILVSNT